MKYISIYSTLWLYIRMNEFNCCIKIRLKRFGDGIFIASSFIFRRMQQVNMDPAQKCEDQCRHNLCTLALEASEQDIARAAELDDSEPIEQLLVFLSARGFDSGRVKMREVCEVAYQTGRSWCAIGQLPSQGRIDPADSDVLPFHVGLTHAHLKSRGDFLPGKGAVLGGP